MEYLITGITAWVIYKLLDHLVWDHRKAIYDYLKAVLETIRLGQLREDDFKHPWRIFGYDSYTCRYLVDIQRTNPYVDDGSVEKGNIVVDLTYNQIQLHKDCYYSKDFQSNCF